MPFTEWAVEFDLRKHGSFMQGQEIFHIHHNRGITMASIQYMIEQVESGFGFIKGALESNQTNKGVFQKVFSVRPSMCTFGTDFKRTHFQILFDIQKVGSGERVALSSFN